jgi:hypothetical protein
MAYQFKIALAAAVSSLAFAAAPAHAALVSNGTICANNDISPTASDCAGFYDGNLLNQGGTHIQDQKDALSLLGFSWDGNFAAVEKISGLGGSKTVDFATALNGISFLGFHFGNGKGGPGEGTAFYKLDAGTNLDQILLKYSASSDAVLYSTGAVPEPATWGMMLLGIGLIGGVMRRRQRQAVSYNFA